MSNILRSYQGPQIIKLIEQLSNNNQAALVSCVGSGKTLVSSIVSSELVRIGIVDKVLIAAPYNSIVDEFPTYTNSEWVSSDNKYPDLFKKTK